MIDGFRTAAGAAMILAGLTLAAGSGAGRPGAILGGVALIVCPFGGDVARLGGEHFRLLDRLARLSAVDGGHRILQHARNDHPVDFLHHLAIYLLAGDEEPTN